MSAIAPVTPAKKINLKGIPVEEFEQMFVSMGHPAFRARQLFRWIYLFRENDFDKMTDLSKKFREDLKANFELPSLTIHEQRDSSDGTIKFLVKLPDGETVESVYIPSMERATLCVSTQVGCKMACTFCATGYMKFTRNLQAWEIVDQLMALPFPKPISNIVMMGMGEPFDNYDEVVKALKIMQDPMGTKIGKRHITVSTVGISPKIKEFVEADLGKIAISLHGTTEEQRGKIMPINKKYPIADIMELCRNLKFPHRGRVTFEYILIKDLNDSLEDAHRLVALTRGIPCKINLLAYNENPFIDFKRPDEQRVLDFQAILLEANLTATYRRSRGRDIAAACGQLRTEDRLKIAALMRSKGVKVPEPEAPVA